MQALILAVFSGPSSSAASRSRPEKFPTSMNTGVLKMPAQPQHRRFQNAGPTTCTIFVNFRQLSACSDIKFLRSFILDSNSSLKHFSITNQITFINSKFRDTAVRTQYVLHVTSPVSLLTQTSFHHTFCTVHTVHTVCSLTLL